MNVFSVLSLRRLIVLTGVAVASLLVTAQPMAAQANEIHFKLHVNPKFLNCLRDGSEEPVANVTVVRGKLNDTLILDVDGIKPGLKFDMFTVQHSSLLANGKPDPAFKNFGLAWYQSDIEISKEDDIDKDADTGHVKIKTILLDQIFGFDPAVGLAPTNTFHVGFWFNNPEDAEACGFDDSKPTPFNGEHKADRGYQRKDALRVGS